jgi:iron-sulfur cluster assembly protein
MRELELTPSAQTRIKQILADRPGFIRIKVNRKGCAGLVYYFDLVDEKEKTDQTLQFDGFDLFLDPLGIMFIIGTQVDYLDDVSGSRFVFTNPSMQQCGCGQSFRV